MRDTINGHEDLKPLSNSTRFSGNTHTPLHTSLKPHEQFLMKKDSTRNEFVPGDLVFAAFSNYSWPAIVTQIGEKTLEIVTLILEQDEIIEKDRAALFEGTAQLEKILSVLTPGERLDFEEASQSLIELSSVSKQDRLKFLENGMLHTPSDTDASQSDHESFKENLAEGKAGSIAKRTPPKLPNPDVHTVQNENNDAAGTDYTHTNGDSEVKKLSCDVNDITLSPVQNHLDKILNEDAVCSPKKEANPSDSEECIVLNHTQQNGTVDKLADSEELEEKPVVQKPKKKLSHSQRAKLQWAKRKEREKESSSLSDNSIKSPNDSKNSRKRKRTLSKEELDEIKITSLALARAKKLQELLNNGVSKESEASNEDLDTSETVEIVPTVSIKSEVFETDIVENPSAPVKAKKARKARIPLTPEAIEVKRQNLAKGRALKLERIAARKLLESSMTKSEIAEEKGKKVKIPLTPEALEVKRRNLAKGRAIKFERIAAKKLLESSMTESEKAEEKGKKAAQKAENSSPVKKQYKPLTPEAIEKRCQSLVKARAKRLENIAAKKLMESSKTEENSANSQPAIETLPAQPVSDVTAESNDIVVKSEPISIEETSTVVKPKAKKGRKSAQNNKVKDNEEESIAAKEQEAKEIQSTVEETVTQPEPPPECDKNVSTKSKTKSTDESTESLEKWKMVDFLAPYYFNLFTDQIKEQIENQIKLDIEGLTVEEKGIISRVLNKPNNRGSGKIKKQAYGIISKLVKNSPCQKLLKTDDKDATPDVGPGTPPASPKQEPRVANNVTPCLNMSNRALYQGVVHNPFPISLVQVTERNKNDYLESKSLPKHTIIPKTWSSYMGKKYNLSTKSPHKPQSPKQEDPPKSNKRKKTESPGKKTPVKKAESSGKAKESKSCQTLKVKKLAVLFRIKDIQKTITNPLELNAEGVKWGELEKKTRTQYLELSKRISALSPDQRNMECLALDLFVKNSKDATRLDWDSLKQTKQRKFLADAKKVISKNNSKEKDHESLSNHNEELIMELMDMESRKRKRVSNGEDSEPSSKKEKSDGTLLDFLCISCFTIEYNPKLFTNCSSCHAMFHKTCLTEITQKKDPKPKYQCTECSSGTICWLCRKPDNLKSCLHCTFKYHEECVRPHMSTQVVSDTSFICPYHVCGSCEARPEISIRNFVKCVRCPQSFHENHIPAGCMRLSKHHILCYRHYKRLSSSSIQTAEASSKGKKKRKSSVISGPKKYKPKKLNHVNVPFCFQCTFGGELVCCEGCPASFHKDCIPDDNHYSDSDSSWLCPDCIVGKKPFIGDIIWVKFGAYRWWPCQILDELDLPDNIFAKKHTPCQFPVICLGTREFAWIDMEKVYSYEDGDKGGTLTTTGGITNSFKLSIVEAKDLHAQVKPLKDALLKETSFIDKPSSKKPAPFRFIKVNLPYNTAMRDYEKQLRLERMPFPCDCTATDKCSADSSCINRVLLTECPPSCKWGEECENQRFQRRQYPATKLVKTEGRGWGMVCCEDISPGTLVHEYVGEIIDEAEVELRLNQYQSSGITDYYMLTVENSRIIDAKPKANNARFMNHSCDPNCETQKWNVCGLTCIGLFAKQEIKCGDELTFDYQFDTRGQVKKACLCGAPNCSGYLGVPAKKIVEPGKEKKIKKKKRKRTRKPKTETTEIKTEPALSESSEPSSSSSKPMSSDPSSSSNKPMSSEPSSSSNKPTGRPRNAMGKLRNLRFKPPSKTALKKARMGRKTASKNTKANKDPGIESDVQKIEAIVNSNI